MTEWIAQVRYAVIGAGPHGLSALKALLQNGIDADGFEREAEVGGNWNFGAENSRVYQSTHLISSKPFTQFPDFPMPDRFPDYPSHAQIKEYFTSYARHFGLLDRIRFQTDVVRVTPIDGGATWLVTTRDRVSGVETSAEYAGVVIANGHNWNPKMPHYPGQETFGGEIIHSAEYKGADILRGRRVLVVGAGNTGCDVAVDSAQNAAATWHSTRRGYYYNPKFVMGRPSDQTADLLLALRLPLALRRQAFKTTLKLTVGDFAKFGLKKPDHEFFETHPIVNQQLVYYVGHGDITPADDIDHFDADGVVFTDGRRADVDLVVFCTGYLVTFPFLPDAEEQLNWQGDHPVLALQVFTPRHRNLFVSGLIQPDSGQWTLAHWQGMTIARFIEAGEGTARRRRPVLPRRSPRRPDARSPPARPTRTRAATTTRSRTRTTSRRCSPRSTSWRAPDEPRGTRGTTHARHAAVGLVAAPAPGEPPRGRLGTAGDAHRQAPAADGPRHRARGLVLRGELGARGGRGRLSLVRGQPARARRIGRRAAPAAHHHPRLRARRHADDHGAARAARARSATRWARSSRSSWPSGTPCADSCS